MRYRQLAVVVDTTGGGDAFQGAFLAGYLQSGSVLDALRAGAERAALTIARLGANTLSVP